MKACTCGRLALGGIVLATLGWVSAAQAAVGFTHVQTDAATGEGHIGLFDQGILFAGALPAPQVIQNDSTAQPVPSTAVGFITAGTEGNPGGGVGVHLGWSGDVTLQGQVRDDLDPNTATSDPNILNVYEITVPLEAVAGSPHSYRFNTFDDNSGVGGLNDVTNNLTHRAWIGDNGAGHRHTDGTFDYDSGADTFTAQAGFNLGGNASGDALGISAGVGSTAPNDTLFVDDIAFRGLLSADSELKLIASGPVSSTPVSGVITDVTLSGSGLAPEGAVIETGGFGEDALMFTDRDHEWNSAAGEPSLADLDLVGIDFIRLANDDRTAEDIMVDIELAPGAKDLFLLIDERIAPGAVFDILNGNAFVDTGIDIGADEGGNGNIDNTSSLFILPGFDGLSITLGPQDDGGMRNMYGFLARPTPQIIPEPATATLALLGLGALSLCRRRRAAREDSSLP